MSDVLPQGWIQTNLESIAFINMGQSPKSIYYNSAGKGLPFFQGKAEFGHVFPTPRKWCSKPTKIAEPKDILLSVRAPVGPTNLCFEQSCIGRGLASIRGYKGVNQSFLYYFFKNIEGWLQEQGTGSTFQAISGGFVRQLSIHVPPENEQKRIAEKLEQLLTAVDTTKKRLDKVPNILKRFRQSVLADAVSGELTKDWRVENDRLDESKDYQNENDWPASWQQIPLGDLSRRISYGSSKKSQSEGDVPVIRMGNIQQGEINWEKLVYTSDEDEIKKYALSPGDVLFNRTNSPELVGKTAIYRGEQKAINAGYLIKVCTSDELDPEYLNICLNSPYGRDYCWQVKTDGVSQSNINAKKLAAFLIRLPSKEEQIEISLRVTTLLNLALQLEQKLVNSRKIVEKLGQSLLVKAFRGELVPQNSADEPAELLLKKITKAKREKKASKPVKTRKETMPSKAKKGSLDSIVKTLKSSEKPISGQQLLAVCVPSSPDSDEIEAFFVALRDCLTNKEIIRERRGDEDWFTLSTGVSIS